MAGHRQNLVYYTFSISIILNIGRINTHILVRKKHSKKPCTDHNVIVTLNADNEKYFNSETRFNGNLIGNVCVRCHNSEVLNFFGIPQNS